MVTNKPNKIAKNQHNLVIRQPEEGTDKGITSDSSDNPWQLLKVPSVDSEGEIELDGWPKASTSSFQFTDKPDK